MACVGTLSTAQLDAPFDDPAIDAFLNENVQAAEEACDKESVIGLLQDFNIIDLLKQDFYLRTNYLNKRSLLDEALFMNEWCSQCDNYFSAYLFFNQYTRKNFTTKRDTINAYLAVGDDQFIDNLQAILEEIEDLINFDTESAVAVLSLIENFVVEERRLGFMFSGQYTWCDWRLRVKMPLQYHERNYFANLEIQNALQELLDPITGAPSPQEEGRFQREHLISDQFGVGDTRIEIDYPVVDTCNTNMRAGFLATIPTAYAFKKGLYGSFFCRNRNRPTIDLCLLVDQEAISSGALEQAFTNFFLQAMDYLSAILLDTRLGNNGHFGLGALLHSQGCLGKWVNRPWAQNIKMRSRLSAEYLIPKEERVFFIEHNNAAEFDCRDFDDENQVDSNFDFLTRVLTNRFFPFNFKAKVSPGVIFRSTSRLIYERCKWGGYFGFDSYLQIGQGISEICAPDKIKKVLCKAKAEKSWIYQSRIIGGLSYRIPRSCSKCDVILSLNGGLTYMTRGLGKDFTLSFNIDTNF